MKKAALLIAFCIFFGIKLQAQKGYHLWLDYSAYADSNLLKGHKLGYYFNTDDSIARSAKKEFQKAVFELTNQIAIPQGEKKAHWLFISQSTNENIKKEGFHLYSNDNQIIVEAKDSKGLLYGTFKLINLIQRGESLKGLDLLSNPKIALRMLNHWDNLDRTVERGYAGNSIFDWHTLPKYINPRYIDYARANASIGINSVSLTNVNANAQALTPAYLQKVKALADTFRPYGIRVFLTARFSAPIEIGGLATADPLDENVARWWKEKAAEIYRLIPDFGGFLVKANSEGQPGPQNYKRNHADGANMLAKALAPFGGDVIWRAFVYSEFDNTDRAKQAYNEFVPLDGQFEENVIIQIKNGPIDFQPREPFHPLFGAMPNSHIGMEFQITQEYLGFGTHLAYLPVLFSEVLKSHTYKNNNTVADLLVQKNSSKSLIAGVSNIGSELNWTMHPFGQANWYGFGKLAWDPDADVEQIAKEWVASTLTQDAAATTKITQMMLESREAVVNYTGSLGLHHLFDTGHHYGPGPWVSNLSRPEWNPTYYHQADENGIGFDRTESGSNATAQYAVELQKRWNNPKACPEELLLWFHHLPWDYKLNSGLSLWEQLTLNYQKGVKDIARFQKTWQGLSFEIHPQIFKQVEMLLRIQYDEALWWKDASISYFQQFSKQALPKGVEPPLHDLNYYQSLKFPFAPGTRPSW